MTSEECPYCGHERELGERCTYCGSIGSPPPSLLEHGRVSYRELQTEQIHSFQYAPKQGLIPKIVDSLKSPQSSPPPPSVPPPALPGPSRTSGASRRIPPKLRAQVLERDGFRCMYCGRGPPWTTPGLVLEVDHVQSWRDGGLTVPENLVTSCMECNRGKGARSMDLKRY